MVKFIEDALACLLHVALCCSTMFKSTDPEGPNQKSNLPKAGDARIFDEMSWSSYRPQLYFGLKNRRPDSPVFGLTWYQQGEAEHAEEVPLRNWALEEDNLVFMWKEHNGRDFGRQELTDQNMELTTDWFSFGRSSWMMQLRIRRTKEEEQDQNQNQHRTTKTVSFVAYLALQDQTLNISLLNPTKDRLEGADYLPFCEGHSPGVGGNFVLKVRALSDTASVPSASISQLALLAGADQQLDLAKVSQLIKGSLRHQPDNPDQFGFRQSDAMVTAANLVAVQINLLEDTTLEFVFESEEDQAPPNFTIAFEARRAKFQREFDVAFPMPPETPPELLEMARCTVSNLLGGIGVWHGSVLMRSSGFADPEVAHSYGPHHLISAVPSRVGFPRGFIWDEGFHNLLISRFDPELSLQIIGSYLDMMNIDGWIPREIAIGSEAEARIPSYALVQDDAVANPPTFFMFVRSMMARPEIMQKYGTDLARMYPRMRQLYLWLRDTQSGPKPGTFRWRGRNTTTDRSLNPVTLPSGIDDYPRATHPTDQEYHLDLRCWMAMSATVLLQLAELAKDTSNFVAQLRTEEAQLNDMHQLDELHWSEEKHRFFDYGLHSEDVMMIPQTEGGETVQVRRVHKDPEYGLVDNVNGYPNLFPLLLKLLPADSPRLVHLLRDIADPDVFWSPYGLRSISTLSPYYNAWNNEWHGSRPYWRGNIWINMNYLALDALKHYSALEGPNQAECARLYNELRENIVANMAKEYARTGFIWEHYDDGDGRGGGQHPFTGWSALVVNMMAEIY